MTTDVAMRDNTASPIQIMGMARERAQSLKEVIQKKDKPVILKGEQYLEYEDWQTLAEFYGATPIVIDGVHGFKASADLIDRKTGNLIGGAEAYCMRDETQWKDKPSFQLASMAQTRAGSKACSNNLRWVVVLVGFKGTPAEEMESMERVSPPVSAQRPPLTRAANSRGSSAVPPGAPPAPTPNIIMNKEECLLAVGVWGWSEKDLGSYLKANGISNWSAVKDWNQTYENIKTAQQPPKV
jgi:hypothetical protein